MLKMSMSVTLSIHQNEIIIYLSIGARNKAFLIAVSVITEQKHSRLALGKVTGKPSLRQLQLLGHCTLHGRLPGHQTTLITTSPSVHESLQGTGGT